MNDPLRFLVFLPLCIGIFNCIAGIMAREVFMLALGVMSLICAIFIDWAIGKKKVNDGN